MFFSDMKQNVSENMYSIYLNTFIENKLFLEKRCDSFYNFRLNIMKVQKH